MNATTNVTLDGIVEGVPEYLGKFYQGPIFYIPFKITGVEPSNAHEEYKRLLEKKVEIHYKEQVLPIIRGNRLRIYCDGYSLPETRAPNQVVQPEKIELIDREGNVIAKYS